MRTWFKRGKSGSRTAPRELQKVLSEEQIQEILQRETSRADRTGRQFSVVLFEVQSSDKRWCISTCRMAKTLLSRVRQTDDIGWFDERHLCAVLADTPAAGARVFAARTCDEIARKQPRPLSMVYGYPGTVTGEPEEAEVSEHYTRLRTNARNGNGHANGHANGNGRHNGHANGHGRQRSSGASTLRNGGSDDDSDGPDGGVAVASNAGLLASAIALAEAPPENLQGLSEGERDQFVGYFLDGVSSGLKKAKLSNKPDAALEDVFVRPMPRWKRALDLLGASFGIIVFSPVLAIAAMLIKLTSPGPAVFKQKRTGLGGREFTIYKFRTMCVDAERKQDALRAINEQDGPAFKLKKDPRVTRIGSILRKTSIDELPQLFNVILGDMSLVGPRPLPVKEQNGVEQWQRHRLNVTPGLTCIWQVDGRSEVSFDEWVRMDVKYMRRQSLWHDLSIIFRTVPAVLLKKGAR